MNNLLFRLLSKCHISCTPSAEFWLAQVKCTNEKDKNERNCEQWERVQVKVSLREDIERIALRILNLERNHAVEEWKDEKWIGSRAESMIDSNI